MKPLFDWLRRLAFGSPSQPNAAPWVPLPTDNETPAPGLKAMGLSNGAADEMPVMQTSDVAASGTRTITTADMRIEIDLGSQILRIGTLPDDCPRSQSDTLDIIEAPLSATLDLTRTAGFVSASVLAQKAKAFDDGLHAAVDIAAQQGSGRHAGIDELLRLLGRAIAAVDPSEAGDAQEMVLGAARLGGVRIANVPDAVEARVRAAVDKFLADPARSKPLGFYTWSPELERIFRQDRMLQGEIPDLASVNVLSNALRADPSARAVFERHLRLCAALTNPFAHPDLRTVLDAAPTGPAPVPPEGIRFFPPSVSHEAELVHRLFGDRPIPEGFVLVDEMIRRIRSGELNLSPRDNSGWYDYQTWALEPLVMPEKCAEGARLLYSEWYREVLLDLFKGLLTLTRETHVKLLVEPWDGVIKWRVEICPLMSVEPLGTFYLRRAIGYRFVRGVLDEAFGPGVLESMRRLTQAGPVEASLGAELAAMETLFLGAHATVSSELGLHPDPALGSAEEAIEAAQHFSAWAGNLQADPDLAQDQRAMVPVFFDIERKKHKVWVFLGWAHRPIDISFASIPHVAVYGPNGEPCPDDLHIRWLPLSQHLPYPVTAELYVDRLLDRDEFRKICDGCGTRSEILKRLAETVGAVLTE